MAVGFETANAAVYKRGAWEPPVQPTKGEPFSEFTSVSCPSESFCLAITSGTGVIYENGSWGKPFTIDKEANGTDLKGVSCTSSSFCIVVGAGGKVFTYSSGTWTGPVRLSGERQLDTISCTLPSFCVVGDEGGYVTTYEAGSWKTPQLITTGFQVTSVSCPSGGFCAAADNGTHVYTDKHGVWSPPIHIEGLTTSYPNYVSCTSESFCGAVDGGGGQGWTFNGMAWSKPVAVDGGIPEGLSCTSPHFCLSVDSGGKYFTYSGAAPEFGRCLKQTTKAVGNFDSANCTKLASEDSGTEAEKLTKGNYQWTSGVAKAKFATVLKSGALATLESVGGGKVTCSSETSSGEYVSTRELGKMVAKFTGCESSSGKCNSSGKGVGEIDTHSLGGPIGVETEVVPPSKDHVAEELHSESGNVVEFACGGVSVVVRGSLLHKIVANVMKLTATEKFTASKGIQKPEHFAGGVPKEHTLEMSTNGGAFEQAGWTLSEVLTNEEKVEASTVN